MTTLVISDLSREERERLSAMEQARTAGRLGAKRIPDEALFPGGLDPSDSAVLAILDAFMAGQLERRK